MSINKGNKVIVAKKIQRTAETILRTMVLTGDFSSKPLGDEFPNCSLVVGSTSKTVVCVIEVPNDLKQKISEAVYVVNN